jgi:hypothetical protein
VALLQFNAIEAQNKALGAKAVGMLVFPRVTKGGIGVGG